MPNVGFLPAELIALLIGSGVVVLAYRLGGRIWLWAIAICGLLLNEAWVLWDRAERAGTPYRYQEPLLLTILTVGVPILASAGVIHWLGTRSSNAGVQMAAGSAAGVVTFYAFPLLSYAGWMFFEWIFFSIVP